MRTEPGDVMSDVEQKVVGTPSPASGAGDRTEKARQADRIEITVNGVQIDVSPELEDAVHRAHKGLLRPLPREMTTTQAAEFLDVSRPFVIKLIQRGMLPCRTVGKNRRIPSEAVLDYREQMFQQARRQYCSARLLLCGKSERVREGKAAGGWCFVADEMEDEVRRGENERALLPDAVPRQKVALRVL